MVFSINDEGKRAVKKTLKQNPSGQVGKTCAVTVTLWTV